MNDWYLSLLKDRYPDYSDGAFGGSNNAELGKARISAVAPPSSTQRTQKPGILEQLSNVNAIKQAINPGAAGGAGGAASGNILGQVVNGLFRGQPQPAPMPDPGYDYPVGGVAYPDQPVPPEYEYFDNPDQLYG